MINIMLELIFTDYIDSQTNCQLDRYSRKSYDINSQIAWADKYLG